VKGLHNTIGSEVIKDDVHLTTLLLYAAEVAVVPGSGFLYEFKERGFMRISLAVLPNVLEMAFARMENCATQVLSYHTATSTKV